MATGEEVGPARARWFGGIGTISLALLPIALGLVAYYRPALRGEPLPRMRGDGAFYAYQLLRGYEVGGRWWKLGQDDRIGYPYPLEVARHPGLFEGVDLVLVAALAGRVVRPEALYHVGVLAVLAANGWVAAWLARRLTGSALWAAVAVAIVTLNYAPNARINGHLHLFKLGYVLLAAWAFARYLHGPTARRGAALGLAGALVLQGSFYYGYFLAIGLGAWWLGCLAAGRLGRAHVAATAAAVAVGGLAAAALTFPVWSAGKAGGVDGSYLRRNQREVWLYSAEPWQYLVPPDAAHLEAFARDYGYKPLGTMGETWSFPGYAVLLAVVAYAVARLRGRRPGGEAGRFLDLAMGLSAVFVALSLAGGPAYFLYRLAPSFRCYGRSGMLAMALMSVAAPSALAHAIGIIQSRYLRILATALILAVVAGDGYRIAGRFHWWAPPDGASPAWAEWLADQPPGVRLAAFAPGAPEPILWWGIPSLRDRLEHRHATLNGADFARLDADFRMLGGSYERMNPAGLRFVATLGYRALAFHEGYLAGNRWIESTPWLEPVAVRGPWRIYRVRDGAPTFPLADVRALLARQPAGGAEEPAPAGAWITGPLAVDAERVAIAPARVALAWADENGRLVTRPVPALTQHVFGPGMPAYAVAAPARSGRYDLVFLDDRGRRLASRPYRVVGDLRPGVLAFHDHPDGPGLNMTQFASEPGRLASLRVDLENAGPYYLQSHTAGAPALGEPGAGSLVLRVIAEPLSPGAESLPAEVLDLRLPRDLPPGGRLAVDVPADRLAGLSGRSRITVVPFFPPHPPRFLPADRADLRMTVQSLPVPEVARRER